jgi:hypothetical protein
MRLIENITGVFGSILWYSIAKHTVIMSLQWNSNKISVDMAS